MASMLGHAHIAYSTSTLCSWYHEGGSSSISMVGILGDASIILGPWETITAAIVGLYTNLYVNPVVPGDQDLNAV